MKLYSHRIYSLKEAYQAIHEFFSTYHLHEALEDLDRMYTWACKEKYYKKTAPSNILFHSQQLHRLFSAAEIISYSTGKKISPVLFHQTADKPLPEHYAGGWAERSEWECFPRHLSAEEYLNPYWALDKITEIPLWEQVLQELTEAALSTGTVEGWYPIETVIQWKEIMTQIVEGAWLVEIREG
ncbi:hypothetical protein [Ferruginibacter sp. HRS2-29]|uniref:hypothetical protein n=1 Tax=Ferruginibacter sp. HRS2-29 TaxID=2487334 RepID=UPI0020CDE009|nr:hypothetical protein [Ferruginibacter sp. HRS2-29]MCP9749492.1 hypothetical protein [Ferruginibacter sp. HRS2-29]